MNAMQTGEFVAAFREAFGPVPELPLLFRYTDEPLRPAAKAGGCFFKEKGGRGFVGGGLPGRGRLSGMVNAGGGKRVGGEYKGGLD